MYFRILISLQENYLESYCIRSSYSCQINLFKQTLDWFISCSATNQCIHQFIYFLKSYLIPKNAVI